MFKDKRGQGLSTSAIILIILGVVILAVLVIGFTVGWNTLFPFLERENNVDQVVQNCELACTTGATYDWCTRERNLKASDLPEGGKEKIGSCKFFATTEEYSKYNIERCTALESQCPVVA